MTSDKTLATILRAILDHPADDIARGYYAKRLEELGEHSAAEMLYDQIDYPSRTRTFNGDRAGIPIAMRVTYRRGFAERITVSRNTVELIGEVLRVHPIQSVVVDGCDRTILLFPDKLTSMRSSLGTSGIRPPWVGLIRTTQWKNSSFVDDDPRNTTTWPSRAAMVDGVASWADARLPTAATESAIEVA